MKILNTKFKSSTWSNGNIPTPIVLDSLTNDHIPFLVKKGFDFLLIDVCDKCTEQVCTCNKKRKKVKKEETPKNETD
jgi:hypothetical protein